MTESKNVLVAVLSEAWNDPRVIRQIGWLAGDGWTIDTIGIGKHPSALVRNHFEIDLKGQKPWVKSKLGQAVTYTLLPLRAMFRRLHIDRIPAEGLRLLSSGEYDLIVFDDVHLAPLVKDPKHFPKTLQQRTHIHLDLHEYHERKLPKGAWYLLTGRFRRWLWRLIGDPIFTTRTTVASRIAEMYADDFGIEEPIIVRNSPPFEDLAPTPLESNKIRLIFHGMMSWNRGLQQIVEALRTLDDRFEMTFMLTSYPDRVAELRKMIADLAPRVRIVDPVPMTDLAREVNKYDLEIMFYPPNEPNVEFALPNKFFEAVQGRLGIVIGRSPMMLELVEKFGIGAVVDSGWSSQDLAATLASLTPDQVWTFKRNTIHAAKELNAEAEGRVFMDVVNGR
jgi:glycosyltransferase involved in cell wall biosynthesis